MSQAQPKKEFSLKKQLLILLIGWILLMLCFLPLEIQKENERTFLKVKETSESLFFGDYDVRTLSSEYSSEILVEKIEISKKSLKLYCKTTFDISKASLSTNYSDFSCAKWQPSTAVLHYDDVDVLVFPSFSSLRSRTLSLLIYPEEAKRQGPIYIEISDPQRIAPGALKKPRPGDKLVEGLRNGLGL